MPETLSLESWNFSDGKRLVLNGTAPSSEHVQEVLDFEKALRKYIDPKDGQQMFDPNKGEYLNWTRGANDTIRWSFAVELKHSEALQ